MVCSFPIGDQLTTRRSSDDEEEGGRTIPRYLVIRGICAKMAIIKANIRLIALFLFFVGVTIYISCFTYGELKNEVKLF